MIKWTQKYGGLVLPLFLFFGVQVVHADTRPQLDDDYQTELPQPPAFPLNFKNITADNEESKSVKDEDRERYDPEKEQIGERIRQDSSWSTDWTIDLSDWERKKNKDWDLDLELIAIVLLGSTCAIILALLGVALSRMRFKRKRRDDSNETESIIDHLESVTKNQAHEKLAISGDFDIAVHALLLDVLRAIFKADPEMDRPSITAREIRDSFDEHEIAVDLRPLIQVVEWSRFAERPATEEDYLNLRPRSARLIAIFEERIWRREESIRSENL